MCGTTYEFYITWYRVLVGKVEGKYTSLRTVLAGL